MIVRDRPSLFKLFFTLRGSILPNILPQLLLVAVLSALVVWGHHTYPGIVPSFSGAPVAIMGVTISLFLGFRNNACYDRWWEGRKLWGQMLISARSLSRQTLVLDMRGQGEARRRILSLVIAFGFAMVRHLRPQAASNAGLERLTPADVEDLNNSRNPPDLLLRKVALEVAILRQQDIVTDVEMVMLDHNLAELALVQGACERIRNTPVPFAYSLLLHRTAHIFCFILPFGFDDVLGWFMPLASAIMAYTLFGLDALGDELEEPFGILPNSLPIDAIARTVEINMLEALGEHDLPPKPEPIDYVLM
ncbi:bestrophin family ion channel [Rhizobium sp.]|jgi:ion channel-forming bestrophin family protein|uniref:bestrophin family protein n=1 Tax=Rhizobium sp. TaxID=391 RepID=UPI000E864BFA|nr:bestrophin [Rhizobium sp.]